MTRSTVFVLVVFMAVAANDLQAASAGAGVRRIRNGRGNNQDNGYKGGNGDSVKKGRAEDFKKLKGESDVPICVYLYDPESKNNSRAELFEGSSALGNAEVRDKLRSFKFLRLKSDGSDAKGWPAEWLQRAKNGAAVALISSDLTKVTFFDRDTSKESVTPAAFIAAADAILKYQEALQAQAAKQKAKR